MLDGLKAFLAQIASYVLGRGLGVKHIREQRLQILKTMHLEVKLLVGEGRLIEDVVLIVCLLQLPP